MIRTGAVSQRNRSSEMIGESFDDPMTDRTHRETPAINNAETDLYDELIKNIGNEINYGPENCPPVLESKEIVYEEKQIVSELIAVTPKSNELIAETVSCAKVLRRSRSEMLKRENLKKNCGKLRFLPLFLLGGDKDMFGGVVWLYIFF
ncbi:hypothetical protein ACSBR2_007433 [Camellia fascicularis]